MISYKEGDCFYTNMEGIVIQIEEVASNSVELNFHGWQKLRFNNDSVEGILRLWGVKRMRKEKAAMFLITGVIVNEDKQE